MFLPMHVVGNLETCSAFRRSVMDMLKSGVLAKRSFPTAPRLVPVRYAYCMEQDCFCIFTYLNGNERRFIQGTPEQKVLTGQYFLTLFSQFYEKMIRVDRYMFRSTSKEEFDSMLAAWIPLFEMFIIPWFDFYEEDTRFLVYFDCSIAGNEYFLDMNFLYNFYFRVSEGAKERNIYFVTVSAPNLYNLIGNMMKIGFPTLQNFRLVYGFLPFDRPETLNACLTEEDKQAALLREKIFQTIIERLEKEGLPVIYLNSIVELEEVLGEKHAGEWLLILTHFEKGRLSTRGKTGIGFKLLKKRMQEMAERGALRKDIAIDFMTCENREPMRKLYECGIQYMHLTNHPISTDLAAYRLFELLEKKNAHKLNRPNPFPLGNHYPNELWAMVDRCFFSTMANGDDNIIL